MNSKWIALGAACWMAGCASTGNAPGKNDAPPAAAALPGCVQHTGTRIPDTNAGCTAPGRSYSQTDIATTGQTSVVGALGLLDPSLTVHH